MKSKLQIIKTFAAFAVILSCAVIGFSQNPDNRKKSDELIDRAVSEIAHSDYDVAYQNLKEAIDLNPKNAVAYYQIGKLYSSSSDYQNIILYDTKALDIEPDDADAYLSRGDSYVQLKKWIEALGDLNSAIKFGNKSAFCYSDDVANLINQRYSKLSEAIAAYSKQSERHDSFVSTDRGNAASCQSLNELMPSFVELKTALHRTLFLKLLDPASLENLPKIIENVKNREAEIADANKSINEQKIRFKCEQ